MTDFSHEQAIIKKISGHLPSTDLPEIKELANELQLQSRLLLLLVVNLFGSALALALVMRGYLTSERDFRRVRVQAEDILASLDQGVVTTDQSGVVLNVNPKANELLGYRGIGTQFALRDLPESHRPLDQMRRSVLAGQEVDEDQYTVELDDHLRYLRAGCSLLRDHDKNPAGVVIHLRDVTEKTLLHQRLLRMERYMGLGSLAAGLQHEIKNPLSALALHVQLLKEGLTDEDSDDSVTESLDVLTTEVQRITRVLESFRDFASIKQLDIAETEVADLIQRVIRLTQPEAKQKGISIQFRHDPLHSTMARIDPTRIEQVLLNLVVNSFSAMPKGGELAFELSSDQERIVLNVLDTGCGIPIELQDKVFDPYFTTKATGTGMGLPLCDKIIRQHEGTIDFVSSDVGTTFTIHLPTSHSSKRKD